MLEKIKIHGHRKVEPLFHSYRDCIKATSACGIQY